MLNRLLIALVFVSAATVAAPAQAQTIVEIAQSDSNFSSLVDAVVSQDLVDTLNSDGPFTVFAPTNDAFADLPSYVTGILEKEPDLLTDILLYHVVAEELTSTDVLSKRGFRTVQGERVLVNTAHSEAAFINSSELVALDINADNGVVHVIDRVLLPNTVFQAVIADLKEQIRFIAEERRDLKLNR